MDVLKDSTEIYLIGCPEHHLKLLLTYKMSQDHLELFFGQVRSMGGCNNNPTARHFSAAYKRILVHNDLQDVLKGNCIPLESVNILSVSSRIKDHVFSNNSSVAAINSSTDRNKILNDESSETNQAVDFGDDDYVYFPSSQHLSLWSSNIVAYIAGFVLFKLEKSLNCETCINALTGIDNSTLHSLIRLKSKGDLVHPSDDVINICMWCEKKFRESVAICTDAHMELDKKGMQKIIISVLDYYTFKEIFSNSCKHMYETEAVNNHIVLLIKAVAEKYLQIRYFYVAKQFSASLLAKNKMRSRQTYTKLIHFSGQ